jgi:ribonuclease HI
MVAEPAEVVAPLVAATDGSSLGNPGPGGWCWYVDALFCAAGGEAHTTNNVMELMAVRELLSATATEQPLRIMADSRYVIDALTKWVWGWKKRDWKTAKGDPVANRELIEEIHQAMDGRSIEFVWVRGHAGHPLNEAADVRARTAAEAWRARR